MSQSTIGTRAVVVQQSTTEDKINYRLFLDGVETTITGIASCKIYSPSGSVLNAAPTSSYSGSVATIQISFPEATYPLNEGYFVKWELANAVMDKKTTQYFDVVRRRFESQVSDNDILTLHPYLTLPASLNDYSSFRLRAWRKIERTIRARFGTYPGNIFFPGDLYDAQISYALAAYFQASAFTTVTGSEDWEKSKYFEQEGSEQLELVLSNISIDLNDDGLIETNEKNYFLGGVSLIR